MRGPISEPTDGSGHRARLRKRLFDGGAKALLDHELVEYLLALAIPRRDTKPLAKRLIARVRRDSGRLLIGRRRRRLAREGSARARSAALKIAQATALRLLETRVEGRPVLSSWEALGDYLHGRHGAFARSRRSACCSSTPRTC